MAGGGAEGAAAGQQGDHRVRRQLHLLHPTVAAGFERNASRLSEKKHSYFSSLERVCVFLKQPQPLLTLPVDFFFLLGVKHAGV